MKPKYVLDVRSSSIVAKKKDHAIDHFSHRQLYAFTEFNITKMQFTALHGSHIFALILQDGKFYNNCLLVHLALIGYRMF